LKIIPLRKKSVSVMFIQEYRLSTRVLLKSMGVWERSTDMFST